MDESCKKAEVADIYAWLRCNFEDMPDHIWQGLRAVLSEAALKSTRKPPVDTINIKREVLQGVKSILIRAYPQIAYDDEGGLVTARHSLEIVDGMQKTLASLDAVLSEGE